MTTEIAFIATAASAPASAIQLSPANETLQQFAVATCAGILVLAVALWVAWWYLRRNPPKVDRPETQIEDWYE